MISARSNLSIKKRDLPNQKTPAAAISSLYFAHKATVGDTGINLASLVNPSAEMPNHIQPTATQLNGANLLFSQNNLILTSSARGVLINKMSYTVASNSLIQFVGFTALAGEIFTGLITSALATGTRVVSSAVAPVTGTLAATQTDFPVGTPFRAGAFSTAQVGEVMVFLDGLQQYRNTGNSNVTLDGNYYEVDPGSGISSVIRFNTADPVNARAVTVIYTNAVSERPDGSQMAAIEAIQGQVNTMIPVLADASGQPQSYFRAAPTGQDMKAFGDKVLKLQELETTPGSGLPKLATTTVAGAVVVPNSHISVNTFNAQGSNAYSILFANLTSSAGTAITRVVNAASGDGFVINENGIYAMTLGIGSSSSGYVGISKNGDTTQFIYSIPAANALIIGHVLSGTLPNPMSVTVPLIAGDVIRAHTGTALPASNNAMARFHIVQLVKQ